MSVSSKTPPKGYLLDELEDGFYGIRDGIDQSLFLVSRQPATHVIYSHAHVDHIGAAHLFPPTATVSAHARTTALLRQANDPRRPVPTQTVAEARTHLQHAAAEAVRTVDYTEAITGTGADSP